MSDSKNGGMHRGGVLEATEASEWVRSSLGANKKLHHKYDTTTVSMYSSADMALHYCSMVRVWHLGGVNFASTRCTERRGVVVQEATKEEGRCIVC